MNLNPENESKCTNCYRDLTPIKQEVPIQPIPQEIKVVPKVSVESKLGEKEVQRIKDFTADLEDDGKRNFSNREKKSSKSTGKMKNSLME